MIRQLKLFLEWLDKRYPPRVRVTDELFQSMLELDTKRVQQMNSHAVMLDEQRARIVAIEKSLAAIKDAMVKGAGPAIAPEKRRADFVASGRMTE